MRVVRAQQVVRPAPTPGHTRSTPAARNAASLVVPATASNGVPAADAIARSMGVSPT